MSNDNHYNNNNGQARSHHHIFPIALALIGSAGLGLAIFFLSDALAQLSIWLAGYPG